MAILLIVLLYALAGISLRAVAALDMSNEVRLAFNVIGGVGALVLPIVVYSVIDHRLTRRAVNTVGLNSCTESGAESFASRCIRITLRWCVVTPRNKNARSFAFALYSPLGSCGVFNGCNKNRPNNQLMCDAYKRCTSFMRCRTRAIAGALGHIEHYEDEERIGDHSTSRRAS